MKVRQVALNTLKAYYAHPCVFFFRTLELQAIYNVCHDLEFNNPTLDVGCGDGFITSVLFDERFTFGIDNGEAHHVKQAIEAGRYDHVLLESAEKMSLPASSVEFVFSNSVLEHIPDLEAVLSEVSRILQPGGKFLFTVPSQHFGEYLYLTNLFARMGLGMLGKSYAVKRNRLLNHYHCYPHGEWSQRLVNYGIRLIAHRYYISRAALMLWDQMALAIFLGRAVGVNLQHKIGQKYAAKIEVAVMQDMVHDEQGACVLILGEKQ